MKGVCNKVLKVDLSQGTCTPEDVPDKIYEYFLGGAGLAAYYLWKECPAGTTAFNPANRLTFAAGPLNGAAQSGAGKWSAGAISPAFNLNSDSAATASFGIAMKQAGYDAIVTYGRADKPVYLVVDDGEAVLKDASAMWGTNAYETEDAIHAAEGDNFEVVSIGQAGERLVRFANIQTRKKSFLGRTGLGAVMGSKNLKGVAVRGKNKYEVADPKKLKKLNAAINKRLVAMDKEKPEWMQIKKVGTAMATELFAPQGNLPLKNYSLAEWPEGVDAWHASQYYEKLEVTPWPCKYCVIQCHNKTNFTEGPYAYQGKGPEYESFAMMGFNTLCKDVRAISYACELANYYSLDTISLGVAIAFAMEAYEKGIITKDDTYGIDLVWGNDDAVVEMTKHVGLRSDGLGYLLGEGVKLAAEALGKGAMDFAVQMKGIEIAAHNWRAQYISALNYATGCAAGPSHERGNSQHIWVGHITLPEWGLDHVENEERWEWKKAPDINAKFHDYCNIINSAGHCKFQEFRSYNLTDLTSTLNAIMGLDWDIDDLRKCGERMTTLQKLLNVRYGWESDDDFDWPKRFFEPVSEGPAAGKVPLGLGEAIQEYYAVRGWDNDGIPTEELLKRLDMDEYAAKL